MKVLEDLLPIPAIQDSKFVEDKVSRQLRYSVIGSHAAWFLYFACCIVFPEYSEVYTNVSGKAYAELPMYAIGALLWIVLFTVPSKYYSGEKDWHLPYYLDVAMASGL